MRKYKGVTAFAVVILLVGLFCFGRGILMVSAESTQQKINKTEQEKNNLEGKLNEQQENITGLKGEHKTLQKELGNLNQQLSQISGNLEELENQIREKEQEISDTIQALEEAKAEEARQYENMVSHVRSMYEHREENYLNALLQAGRFADLLNAADCFEKIADYSQTKFEECRESRKRVEETEARLQAEKIELDNLKVACEAEKSKVSGLIGQTSSTMNKYANEISDAEKKAKEYEEKIREKEQDLKYLKKKLEEEIRLSQSAANSVWRDISEVTFSDGDRALLANLIYCEAGGEPYAGQLAVGSVVVNRVLSSVYPDSMIGVIYQKNQFSPVGSGRLELALTANKATSSCYRAADEAMSGVTNIGGCVYFRTPVEGLSGITIGGHVFY